MKRLYGIEVAPLLLADTLPQKMWAVALRRSYSV